MDSYEMVALLLWSCFGLSLIALLAGIAAAQTSHRQAAIVLLLVAELGTLIFSFIGGFSIGRFTAVIPVILSGYVLAMGRSRWTVGACVTGAVVVYVLFSWLLSPLVLNGGVLALLFGFWAIPLYGLLAVLAFGSAFAQQARRGSHPSIRSGI